MRSMILPLGCWLEKLYILDKGRGEDFIGEEGGCFGRFLFGVISPFNVFPFFSTWGLVSVAEKSSEMVFCEGSEALPSRLRFLSLARS